MLSKSSLCVYISDGCVKRLLGWITHQLPSEEGDDGVGGGGIQPPHPPLLSGILGDTLTSVSRTAFSRTPCFKVSI